MVTFFTFVVIASEAHCEAASQQSFRSVMARLLRRRTPRNDRNITLC